MNIQMKKKSCQSEIISSVQSHLNLFIKYGYIPIGLATYVYILIFGDEVPVANPYLWFCWLVIWMLSHGVDNE